MIDGVYEFDAGVAYTSPIREHHHLTQEAEEAAEPEEKKSFIQREESQL